VLTSARATGVEACFRAREAPGQAHAIRWIVDLARQRSEDTMTERLSGEGIPYLARAFQLLDAFDALTSERPYKRAFSAEESCEILEKEALDGKWDPVMLEEFLVLRRGQREKNFLASREPQAEASGRDGP
jgi:hypothetical protein